MLAIKYDSYRQWLIELLIAIISLCYVVEVLLNQFIKKLVILNEHKYVHFDKLSSSYWGPSTRHMDKGFCISLRDFIYTLIKSVVSFEVSIMIRFLLEGLRAPCVKKKTIKLAILLLCWYFSWNDSVSHITLQLGITFVDFYYEPYIGVSEISTSCSDYNTLNGLEWGFALIF